MRRRLLDETIKREASGEQIVSKSCARMLNELDIFGKSTQSGTPSPETPVEIVSAGQSGQINVDVNGGNLLKPTQKFPKTENGMTLSQNIDGSYHLSGTAILDGNIRIVDPDIETYGLNIPKCTLSLKIKNGEYDGELVVSKPDKEWKGLLSVRKNHMSTGSLISDEIGCFVTFTSGVTYNVDLYPMLNVGSSALPFEPYKQPQTLILTTPNGLPGIPVSGDDYTYIDSAGQKWIADSIEYRRNGKCVRVQRITKETIVDGFSFAETPDVPGRYIATNVLKHTYKNGYSKSMCNIAVWSNWGIEWGEVKTNNWSALNNKNMYFTPKGNITNWNAEKVNNLLNGIPGGITVLGQLADPIETPLTSEEIEAFKALHTNEPTTTIMNDENCGQRLIYKTKKYLEVK